MLEITDSNFDQSVLKSEKPVLLDCYTNWCQPCKILKSLLSDLSTSFESVTIAAINIENSPELAKRLKITAVPVVFVFKNGQVVEEIMGLRKKDEYEKLIRNLI